MNRRSFLRAIAAAPVGLAAAALVPRGEADPRTRTEREQALALQAHQLGIISTANAAAMFGFSHELGWPSGDMFGPETVLRVSSSTVNL